MSKRNEFVTTIISRLMPEFSEDQIDSLEKALTDVVCDYEIEPRNTDIVPTEDFIPEYYWLFIARKKLAGRSEGTIKLYNYYCTDFFLHKPAPISEMDSALVIKYLYDFQRRRKVGNNTLDKVRIVLNVFFSWAESEGYVDRNFVKSVEPIKYIEKPRQPLTDEEVVMLRSCCDTYREQAIIELLLSTGIRLSELTGLRWSDLDLQNRKMIVFGKGSKYRTVFFNSQAKVALLKYRLIHPGDDPHVFVSDRYPYRALKKEGVARIIKQIDKRKQFSAHVTAHVLRHTFATQAIAKGMDIEKLKTILGHEEISTTLIYAKVDMSQVEHEYQKCFGA